MELRQLRSDEFEISTKLSEYAFQYTLTPERENPIKSILNLNASGDF